MAITSSNTIESDADYRRRERRVRYAARKQGYNLAKSRSRNESAVDCCRYIIAKDGIAVGGEYGGLDLDEVEAYLNQ
jgi:hypothetical protein